MKVTVALLGLALLAACTINEPPIDYSNLNESDKTASCQDLNVEYTANTDRATELAGKTATSGQANDLIDRNISVKELAERKGCNTVLWPEQPEKAF